MVFSKFKFQKHKIKDKTVIKESLVPMHMPRNFKYSCNMHNSSIDCLPHQHLLKMICGPH